MTFAKLSIFVSQLPFGFDVDCDLDKIIVHPGKSHVESQLPFGFDVDCDMSPELGPQGGRRVSIAFRL